MQDIIVNDDNFWMWKIVFDDASTLITLSNNRDGGIMCANLPYYSFFVYEVLHQLLHEYDDKDYFDKIGKYRNSLKIFSDKYAPSVRKMNGVREQHDHFFRKKLRIPFANRLDINYDLGIYFDIDGQIIYDTQMVGDSIIHKIKDKGPGWRIKTYTKLRNCMMHYGLEQNEKCLLNFGNVKPNKPMYGIVDCCIENEAEPFFERLDLELDELYKLIGEEFHFNLKRLQHF